MVKLRSEVPEEDRWDTESFFASDEKWNALYKAAEADLAKYDGFRGSMGTSFEHFLGAIEFDLSVSRRVEALYTYAHLKNDEDKTNQTYQALYERAIGLHTRASEAASFMVPEILSIPEETIAAFRGEEAFSGYRFYLDKIVRYRPHTLSREVEKVLAMSKEMAQGPSQIFSQLNNADLTFGRMEEPGGKEVELTHGNFITFLMNPERKIRKKAFNQYYKTFHEHRHTIAAALSASVKNDCFYSRVKNYDSCLSSRLFADDVPPKVYDNLVSTVKGNFGPLFRYLEFRKKVLGLTQMHIYDTYVPIVADVDFKLPYEEAVEICVAALEPLGKEYTDVLEKGLLGGWVDRYENKGKRSGAYSSGCYDAKIPYILMNYEETDLNSLFTLIHEAGHSMHSWYSRKNQPYHYGSYTIFVAEVASTLNETLLGRHLLERYKGDSRMEAYVLNREIDNIKNTLYRQTMFAEFERTLHEVVERNSPLTLEVMSEAYEKLLTDYFGGRIHIDETLHLECLRIPHFYSAYYVYKYATGISAAIALAGKIIDEGAPARDRYLEFLKLGGSRFPLDELRAAGVDMADSEPIENAISHFAEAVDRLIASLSR